jgi:hypothetical protein
MNTFTLVSVSMYLNWNLMYCVVGGIETLDILDFNVNGWLYVCQFSL